MRFHNFPLVLSEAHRFGLVVVMENGSPEALLDVGKGALLANVIQNATYLRKQHHRPAIVIQCSQATAERYFDYTPEVPMP